MPANETDQSLTLTLTKVISISDGNTDFMSNTDSPLVEDRATGTHANVTRLTGGLTRASLPHAVASVSQTPPYHSEPLAGLLPTLAFPVTSVESLSTRTFYLHTCMRTAILLLNFSTNFSHRSKCGKTVRFLGPAGKTFPHENPPGSEYSASADMLSGNPFHGTPLYRLLVCIRA